MFKYKVEIAKLFDKEESLAESLRKLVDDILKRPSIISDEAFKENLDFELSLLLGEGNFRCFFVTPTKRTGRKEETSEQKSYFISIIISQDYQNPVWLAADYKDLSSLQDIAAWEISKRVKDVEKLSEMLPQTLVSKVKKFL